MSMQKLFTQCDDYLKKIDLKIRNEDYKRIENTEKNLNEIKILFSDFKRTVSKLIKIYLFLNVLIIISIKYKIKIENSN